MVTSGNGPAQQVREVVEPVVAAAGLYLEEVAVVRAGRRSVVRVTVDLSQDDVGSLDSDRLAEVSRDVSAALDRSDPVRGEYVLEVSTPGTSRPLTEPRHFRRARTRLVRLALRDGGAVQGRLVAVTDDEVLELETPAGTTAVAIADVARGTVELDFRGGQESADGAEDEEG
ncbi:MAG: ribosome maturation factor RimP [Actinotalea sp.]|nr:ribosome maturation factor RimP [Actinotalea sp.]